MNDDTAQSKIEENMMKGEDEKKAVESQKLTPEEEEDLAAESNSEPFIPTADDDIPDLENNGNFSLTEAAFSSMYKNAEVTNKEVESSNSESPSESALQNLGGTSDANIKSSQNGVSNNNDVSDDIFAEDNHTEMDAQDVHATSIDRDSNLPLVSVPSHKQQPMSTMETVAAGAGAAASLPLSMASGLGSAVRSLMAGNPEDRKSRIKAAAEKNYQDKVLRMVDAYAGVDAAVTQLCKTEAAKVRDQYAKTGETPPEEVMKRLSRDRTYQKAVKDLNRNLRSIERFGTEASKSARVAEIDPTGLNEILEENSQKLEKNAEQLKGLIDEKGKALMEAVKRMGKKITLLVGALFSKAGPAPEMQ